MMFEKAKRFSASRDAACARDSASRTACGPSVGDALTQDSPAWRAGDALRAVEWGELTARLNAARDLRLLLRTESQAPIEAVAASFGDAAASYFALLDHGEGHVNLDALGQSKAFRATVAQTDANRPDDATGSPSVAPRSDARDRR